MLVTRPRRDGKRPRPYSSLTRRFAGNSLETGEASALKEDHPTEDKIIWSSRISGRIPIAQGSERVASCDPH